MPIIDWDEKCLKMMTGCKENCANAKEKAQEALEKSFNIADLFQER